MQTEYAKLAQERDRVNARHERKVARARMGIEPYRLDPYKVVGAIWIVGAFVAAAFIIHAL